MAQLGLSIYPEQSNYEKDIDYLNRAYKLGFRRLFTSLLQIDPIKEPEKMEQIKATLNKAQEIGYEVDVDINPGILTALGVDSQDLMFFKTLGANIIRLDNEMNANEIAKMTRNNHGLSIELNMSQGNKQLENIFTYSPNRNQLIGSHNFYPQRYTGLSFDLFKQMNEQYKHYGVRSMAFVNAPSANIGPWPVNEGLCTLELHRDLPLATQITHLKLLDNIDDIVISNAYVSQEELEAAADAFFNNYPSIRIHIHDDATDLEREMLLDNVHDHRGDYSDYLIRSSWLRIRYEDSEIEPHTYHTVISPYDITVNNSDYSRYKGEIQIAKKTMPSDSRKNIIAQIAEEDRILIDELPAWSLFKFVEA